MQIQFQRKRVLWVHISFWLVYLSFFLYQVSHFRKGQEFEWGNATTFAAVQLLFTMLIAYSNYFYFLPRFLVHQKLWRYLLGFFIPFVVLVIVRVHLQRYMIDGYTHQRHYFYSNLYIVELIIVTLFITGFISMLRFVADWFQLMATRKEIENERLTAELNFLKAQINPHFLFNTLNNLYYLAYTQSPNTTEVIAKLSQMMRYMIYDSNHDRVPLKKEVEYMENYIGLERLRLNDQIPISLKVIGEVERYTITPFIFITFLENAFKHGVSNSNPKAWVNVQLNLQDNQCIYVVENSKIKSAKPEAEEKSGIGLQNVKRRLELSYPGRHELVVQDQEEKYIVTLKLTLS
jgi:sensor histidine kinase YesM